MILSRVRKKDAPNQLFKVDMSWLQNTFVRVTCETHPVPKTERFLGLLSGI